MKHGWPSFRMDEVHTENVIVDKETGKVTTKCGTHIGSLDNDDKGVRYCINLSCIAGSEA